MRGKRNAEMASGNLKSAHHHPIGTIITRYVSEGPADLPLTYASGWDTPVFCTPFNQKKQTHEK